MATLIVALLLLGIVSGLTLFSLSYGMQDRRAINNEVAGRLVQEAAQAGLDQGLQFFRARASDAASSWLAAGGPQRQWERCAAADTSMPCGAVASAVRANYLRHPGALDMRDVFTDAAGASTQQVIANMGGYDVHYDVYALLCLVDTHQPERQCVPAADPLAPENDPQVALRAPYAITLISRAQLTTGDDAGHGSTRRALVKQTIAPRSSPDRGNVALAVVPGSWSDAGRIDASGNYREN
jgi:type II secretory pathway pseudopilin PulG